MFRRVKPNGNLVYCDVLPGHLLYIPMNLYLQITPVSEIFTHGFTDFELSLNARDLKINRIVRGSFAAEIDIKHDYFWEQAKIRLPIKQLLWRLRFNPKSPPPKEVAYYLRRVSRILWPLWLCGFFLPNLISFFFSFISIDLRLNFRKKSRSVHNLILNRRKGSHESI